MPPEVTIRIWGFPVSSRAVSSFSSPTGSSTSSISSGSAASSAPSGRAASRGAETVPSPGTTSMLTTQSPSSLNLIPVTPRAFRPIARTSPLLKRHAMPFAEERMISSAGSTSAAPIRSSPSSMESARMPILRRWQNWLSGVFLMTPHLVAIAMQSSSFSSNIFFLIVSMVRICSFGSSLMRLMMAFPFPVRAPSGIS